MHAALIIDYRVYKWGKEEVLLDYTEVIYWALIDQTVGELQI